VPDLQDQTIPSENRSQRKHRAILALQEIACCLSIASAVGYALLGYISHNQARPENDSTYYFLRSAFRIDDFLHITSSSAVDIRYVGRHSDSRWIQTGYDLLAVLTVFGIAAILLSLLRLSADSPLYRESLRRAAGLSAIFAAPLCYLYLARLSSGWLPVTFPLPAFNFPIDCALFVFVAEVLAIVIVLVVWRKWLIPVVPLSIFVTAHCAFWVLVPWPRVSLSNWELYASYTFISIFALAGIVWLLYAVGMRTNPSGTPIAKRSRKLTLGIAAVAFLMLYLLWIPPTGHSLLHPKNLDSLTIEMSRGPCFGSCVPYTITILGDGHVDFAQRHSRYIQDLGPQRKSITRDQLYQILQRLDRANFFALEDRAFTWCFDTPSVAISVSLDGRTKQVISDANCTDGRAGTQGRFVESATDIDRIVGTESMLMCEYGPCRR
jgi:hypothetical protein